QVFNEWLTSRGERPIKSTLDTSQALDYKAAYQPMAAFVRFGETNFARNMLLDAGKVSAPIMAEVMLHEGVMDNKQLVDGVRAILHDLPGANNQEVKDAWRAMTRSNAGELKDADIDSIRETHKKQPWNEIADQRRGYAFIQAFADYKSNFVEGDP